MLLKVFVLLLWCLHVSKLVLRLDKAHKYESLHQLGINLHQQHDGLHVSFLIYSEQLPLIVNDCGFGCLEVPLYELVMHFTNRSRDHGADVLSYNVSPLIPQHIVNLFIAMNDGSYAV
jgi:hypothetical protein